jgi:hypothetical protein
MTPQKKETGARQVRRCSFVQLHITRGVACLLNWVYMVIAYFTGFGMGRLGRFTALMVVVGWVYLSIRSFNALL